MIEDLQDEMPKKLKKGANNTTAVHKVRAILIVWILVFAVSFLVCLPGIRKTFKDKTVNQVILEAQDYASSVETRAMTLFYVSPEDQQLKAFTVNVPVTGAGVHNDALEALMLDTPENVLSEFCINCIPKGTSLVSFELENNKAEVILTQDFYSHSATDPDHELAKQQIIKTLLNLDSSLSEVTIGIN